MKNFILTFIKFLLPIIILSLPIDYALSYLVSQNTHDFEGEISVWNDIYGGHIDCDVAIYGSSRAMVQIDPLVLEDSLGVTSYNFGLNGHHFWLEYGRHKEFLKYNRNPKLIIFSLDHGTFQKGTQLYNYAQFLPYMLWNDDIYEMTKTYEGFEKSDFYIPLLRYFREPYTLNASIYRMFNKKPPARTKGYEGKDAPWNSDFDIAKRTIKEEWVFFDDKTIELFKNFIQECKENDIKLMMVYTPTYIDGQNFLGNRKELMELIHSLSNDYNIPFIDYSNDEISFDKKYFYNSTHMNLTGSQKFSKEFAHDLRDVIKENNLLSSQ